MIDDPTVRILYAGSGWLTMADRVRDAVAQRGLTVDVRLRDARPLAEQLDGIHVLLPSNAVVTAEALDRAPALRLIQQPAVGFEGIDVAAARARGIPVCNAPGTNADAVAQAALLLLLSLARRVPLARKAFAERRIGEPPGTDLAGRHLVVVGMGASGSRLATTCAAMGMRVSGVGRVEGREGLLRIVADADAVSFHCPLTAETRGLADDALFAAMRPGGFVVNVARGAIVDRDALERALARGTLGGVGLDVFWDEPWDPADPLFHRDDVVVLPHIAGSTRESLGRIVNVVACNVEATVRGQPLVHRVDGAPAA